MENFNDSEMKRFLFENNIPAIENDANYWFIRTSGGTNFEKFYFSNYVAIGWDEFNDLQELKSITHNDLKDLIQNTYPDDTKPGATAAQIIRFVKEVKTGDYILIPSTNCDRIAFGKITSDIYLYELTNEDRMDLMFDEIEISFLKRRNVQWITEVPIKRSEIDPLLIPIIYSYGTIVDANPYSDYINRTLYDIYYRNGELHSIFNITRTDNIPAYELNGFINTIFDTVDLYTEMTGEEIDKKCLSIKASINSPGPVEIITSATSILIILSAISLFLNGAHLKFKFNILKIAEGEVEIDSSGLIDKIKKLKDSENKHEIKLAEIGDEFSKSKKNLKIRKKSNNKK